MRNGQKCSRLKALSKFIFLLLISGELAFSQFAEVTGKKTLQLGLPLRPCWTFFKENIDGSKIASDKARWFLPLTDGKLLAIDAYTGLPDWETDLGGQIETIPYLFGESIFLVSKIVVGVENKKSGISPEDNNEIYSSDKNYLVRCLNKKTGVVVWQTKISINEGGTDESRTNNESKASVKIYLHLFGDELLIVAADGNLVLLDSMKGKIIKTKSIQAKLTTAPFFDGDQAVFGTLDKRIFLVSIKDLEKITEVKVPVTPTAIFNSRDALIWGDGKGQINSSPNRLNLVFSNWKFRAGGEILNIAPTEKNLLAASLDNYIYSLWMKSGQIRWKKRLSNRPAFAPLVTDNYAVFVMIGDSTALIIETKSGKTVNKITLADENFFTGSPGQSASLIVFPTVSGLFSFTSEKVCEQDHYLK